jgi:type VI secretion system protein VasJ
MLGSLRNKNDWKWLVFGKHQVAKDYFQIGLDPPLLKAFADWFDKGYSLLGGKVKNMSELNTWRFWAQGSKKDLICGFARDSSDNIGRPYPLVVIGMGQLDKWRKKWDLIPFALNKIWSQMEYFSNKRFLDFKQMEDEVKILKTPKPLWKEFEADRKHRYEKLTAMPSVKNGLDLGEMRKYVRFLVSKGAMLVQLSDIFALDPITPVALWHRLIKDNKMDIPNAVFFGGGSSLPYLAAFQKALSPSDFVTLWDKPASDRKTANGPS